MTKSKIRLVFTKLIIWVVVCGILILRFITYPSPLPQSWTPEKSVRFTARILEEPEQTDTQTIIKRGIWTIRIRGHKDLRVGDTYSMVGKLEPQLLLGRVKRIVMIDPTIEEVNDLKLSVGDRLLIVSGKIRQGAIESLRQRLPDTESTLAAGILLGYAGSMPPRFREQLANTGTMHTIAASGYNVAIVALVVANLLKRLFAKTAVTLLSLSSIGLYVMVAGGSASVVRAGVMGSLRLIGEGWGRQIVAKRLLGATALIMLLINPSLILDVGFQLSVAATWGLLYLEPLIHQRLDKWVGKNWITNYLADYLYPTLAATVATLPIIYLTFGRVSLISPLANLLVLPLVPLIMLLTAICLSLSWVPYLGGVASYILYVPLKIFVMVIKWLG